METLNLDLGIKEYQLTEKGILRFNPSDPNVYNRFLNAEKDIRSVEQESAAKANTESGNIGETAIRIMAEADGKIKDILNHIFGHGNNFHSILEGVNVLAVGSNGNRIISNLLDVLTPIMKQGAKDFADGKVAEAKLNRAQRRMVGICHESVEAAP